ncbi:DUF3426 domain-containing protein [Pseudomonas cavernae]|uniref:DUF3426 domain-containing protein n=1 Tax=Pseudomonas cavernae TaxID=2320867 RepID=A0A385Z5S1_9PSED|nr:DUF3426 domain-containing protein [Pseudomonas cavernae]AYC34496.1 DUF3426 domain-containing protein [Pseudomonas cavernae]
MIDSFVTQCPHCSTSFRVTRAQLGAARGAVRCGACMQVFNAGQQLLIDQPGVLAEPAPLNPPVPKPAAPASPAPGSKPQPPAGKKPDDTLWIHDDLDLDSLDLDEELAKLERQELQLSQEFVALERAPKPAGRLLEPREESASAADEAWAEALLRTENAGSPAPPATNPPPSSAPPALPAAGEEADAQPEVSRQEPSLDLDAAPAEDADEPALGLSAARDEAQDDEELATQTPFSALPPPSTADRQPALHHGSLNNLSDEPLQFDWQPPKKPWGRWIAWTLLTLLGAGALAGQYIAYHFDELARQDQYRPWFEQLCPDLGCSLPSKVDIELIKSSNLVVRSHPEFAGALVVDAILYNRAPFSQPFPLLEMRFADINGQLLASRRFKPSEYLSGELAGQAEMPPQTPIHISLDILDPGTQAVNYSLSFHSPE